MATGSESHRKIMWLCDLGEGGQQGQGLGDPELLRKGSQAAHL